MKKRVRKSRKDWQKARRRSSVDVNARKDERKRLLNEYKSKMWRVKEEHWKRLVSDSSNLNP